MSTITDSTVETDPMGSSRFHKVLVFTDDLQKLPYLVLVLILAFFTALTTLFWPDSLAPLFFATFAVLNWGILWMLPRAKRSYGPEKASALALWLVLWVVMLLTGLLGISEIIAYILMAAVTGIAYYSTWVEPFNLGVSQEQLQTAKWNATAPAIRLLHISDLHMEQLTPREKQLNTLIRQLDPDIIVFTGDFVNISYTHDERVKEQIRKVIGEWRAPLGVYCIPGTYTVEPVERVVQFTTGLDNLRLLLDEWVTVDTQGGPLHILGLRARHILTQDRELLAKQMQNAPQGGFKLLLMHHPDIAPDADVAGIDMTLCGHTHGGQIRFPLIGAVFSGSALGMRYVMGRFMLTRSTLYTSRGVGLEGLGAPRARFLCPPEIILWEIRGKSAT